jgi:hypothetical protein
MWEDDFTLLESLIGTLIMLGICYGLALLITP